MAAPPPDMRQADPSELEGMALSECTPALIPFRSRSSVAKVRSGYSQFCSCRAFRELDAEHGVVFKLHENQSTTDGYHNLSHHGQAAEKVRQLEDADRQQMALLRGLLQNLAAKRDGGRRLLDRTMVLYGSNMGDANTHDNSNLPILLAGGGFQHGQHLTHKADDNTPLCNLFVSLLRHLGVECDAFGSSTGELSGLAHRNT